MRYFYILALMLVFVGCDAIRNGCILDTDNHSISDYGNYAFDEGGYNTNDNVGGHSDGGAANQNVDTVQFQNWQDIYAEILRRYAFVEDANNSEWDFVLHDMDGSGIPVLIILKTPSGFFRSGVAAYSFRDGTLVSLEIEDGSFSDFNGGVTAAPDGELGIITGFFSGAYMEFVWLIIKGDRVVELNRGAVHGYISPYPHETFIYYYLNQEEVTPEEFHKIFGGWEELEVLDHPITESSIQEVIFNCSNSRSNYNK